MRKLLFVAVAVAGLVVSGIAVAADLKSGPQAGEKIPGPFHPLNVTGESAGKKACLVCKHGANPVAIVFARSTDCPATAKLLQKLDAATAANSKCEMGSFAVYLTDDDKASAKLEELAKENKIKNLTLSIDNPAGPAKYEINKDADITVVLYNEHKVVANYSFKKGEIKDADIDAIIKDVAKIVPAK